MPLCAFLAICGRTFWIDREIEVNRHEVFAELAIFGHNLTKIRHILMTASISWKANLWSDPDDKPKADDT